MTFALFSCFVCSTAFAEVELQEKATEYWSDGVNWTVYSYPAEDMCEMAKIVISDEHFTFSYHPKDQTYGLVFTNPSAKSLAEGTTVG